MFQISTISSDKHWLHLERGPESISKAVNGLEQEEEGKGEKFQNRSGNIFKWIILWQRANKIQNKHLL